MLVGMKSAAPRHSTHRSSRVRRFVRIASAIAAAGAALFASDASAYTNRHIFVTNRGGSNIIELDDQLNYVATWFDNNTLSVPNGMAFTPEGRLYVADTGHNRIVGYDSTGNQVVTWDASPYTAGSVEALNFNKQGILFVSANPGSGRVLVFNQDGTFVKNLVDAPQYSNLGNVNFTLDAHVIIADFSAQGRGIRELDQSTGAVLGTFGQEAGLLQEDMAVDGADRIFVSQYNKSEIAVFGANRLLERTFTAAGLKSPTGIVITHDCRVIVASFGTAELYEFKHDGTFLRSVTIAGLSLPESLAIAGQGLPGSFTTGNLEFVPTCNAGAGGSGGAGGGGSGGAGGNGGNGGSGGSGGTGGAAQGGAGGAGGLAGAGGQGGAGGTVGGSGGMGNESGAGGGGAGGVGLGEPSTCGCRVVGDENETPLAFLWVLLGLGLRRKWVRP